MTSDELINLALANRKQYQPEKVYHFRQDPLCMEYLFKHYPAAYDFLQSPQLQLKPYPQGVAAVTVRPALTLYLNDHILTFMREQCGPLDIDVFYQTIACLILHEQMHVSLKHFRLPNQGYNHVRLNIAQDMVIDNIIHCKNPGWRNWQETIDHINQAIDQRAQDCSLPKISTQPGEKNYILRLTDQDIYLYLQELNIQAEQTPPRLDEHPWNGDNIQNQSKGEQNSGNQPGPSGNPSDQPGDIPPSPPNDTDGTSSQSQDGQPADQQPQDNAAKSAPNKSSLHNSEQDTSDQTQPENEEERKAQEDAIFNHLLDELAPKSRARLARNAKRHLKSGSDIIDQTIELIAQGREHNLFNLLKKFIKKISYKQRSNTWKKISKKQPYLKPGLIYQKTPGEVLFLIDTSGSMHAFIQNHIADTMYGVYSAFARLAKVGRPSKMYKADVAQEVLKFQLVKSVEELKKIDLTKGGGTDFQEAFEELVLKWREKTQSAQKFPDFILVLSDLEDSWTFLEDPKYRPLANRLIWLATEPRPSQLPPIGHIVNVLADDWAVSIR